MGISEPKPLIPFPGYFFQNILRSKDGATCQSKRDIGLHVWYEKGFWYTTVLWTKKVFSNAQRPLVLCTVATWLCGNLNNENVNSSS